MQSEGKLYDFVERARKEGRISEAESQRALGELQERENQALQVLEKLYEELAPQYVKPVEKWVDEHQQINESWLRTAQKQEGELPPWPPVVTPASVDGQPEEEQTQVMVSNTGILIQRVDAEGRKEVVFKLGNVKPSAEDASPELERLQKKRQRLDARIDSLESQDGISNQETPEPPQPTEPEDDDKEQSPSLLERLEEQAEKDEDPQSKKIERTEGYFDIGLGLNQNLEEGQFLVEDIPGELNFWKSTVFNLGIGRKSRLGSPYSKFYLKYGIDFSWHNFHVKGNDVLQRDAEESSFAPIDDSVQSYETNKYHIAYFNIPLMLQLDFSEMGEHDENFTLGLGGYGGIRMNAKRELEYSTPVFESIESKVKDDFYTNQFRYGAMLEIGYKHFKLRAHYDFNPFFRNGRGPDYQLASLSLGFTW